MCARLLLPFGLSVLGFGPSLAAQGQVWVVDDDGPADFATMTAGIQAAGEGDILLVKQGHYVESTLPGMSITAKSLTIQAEKGATVTIDAGIRSIQIKDLTSSQSARLRGLNLINSGAGLQILDNDGTVWIEDCAISPPVDDEGFGIGGIQVSHSSSVVVIRTVATGASDLYCDSNSEQAGPGLEVWNSAVHAFGCTFQGGNGDPHGYDFFPYCVATYGGHGIESLSSQDFVFLSKSTALGGTGSCAGGGGLFGPRASGSGIFGSGTFEVFDSDVRAGPEKTFPVLQCTAPEGPAHSVSGSLTFHAGRALRFSWESPEREDGTAVLRISGPPHVAVWVASGPKAASHFKLSPFGSTLVGQPQRVDFAGITGDDGQLELTIPVPALLPGIEGRAAFAQAFYLDPHPAGPLGGSGKIRHVPLRFVRGEGSMLVGLDETF